MIKLHERVAGSRVIPDSSSPGKKKGHHQMANHVEIGPALNHAESQGCFFTYYLITVFSA